VFAFDLLSIALAWAMSRRHQMPLIGAVTVHTPNLGFPE
jgi:hypothetical protein